MSRPSPTTTDVQRFCDLDGWEELRAARGRVNDHRRYRKILRDGTILQTRISHGRRQYGPGLWQRIWRHQLGLESPDQFWEVLREKRPVQRPGDQPARTPPGPGALPMGLVIQLVRVAGLSETEVGRLSRQEAEARWTAHVAAIGEPEIGG